jgi:hypothetical protein
MTTSHTITHIPKCRRKKSRAIYLSLLKGVVTKPQDLEAVDRLVTFSKYVLAFARPCKNAKSGNPNQNYISGYVTAIKRRYF